MVELTISNLEVAGLTTFKAVHVDCQTKLEVTNSTLHQKTVLVTWSKTKQLQNTTTHTNCQVSVR